MLSQSHLTIETNNLSYWPTLLSEICFGNKQKATNNLCYKLFLLLRLEKIMILKGRVKA